MNSGTDDTALDNAVAATESAWTEARSARTPEIPTADLVEAATLNVTPP
ncbi:hypothetical protein ACTWPB_22090 [Nocardia sp. IBHARD005]